MKEKVVYKKVCVNKASGQLFITIPKNMGWKNGDYVRITSAD